MTRIFCAIALFFLAIASNAQTLYELEYTNPINNKKYLGLLFYFSDNNCKLRIVRADEGVNGKVWESEYIKETEPKTRDNEQGQMYYRPKDGRGMPILLWYWRDFRAEDMNKTPRVLIDMFDIENSFYASKFEEVQMASLSLNHLAKFYKKSEPEYKAIAAAIQTTQQQNKKDIVSKGKSDPTLRLLMVANTEVDDIGIACQQDVKNITNEFRNIARVLEIPYEQTVISESAFNKNNVAKAVKEFSPNPNDIAVFIYSGHGFRFKDQKEFYPSIDLSPTAYDKAVDNYSTMTDIYNEIIKKGAKLNIVLSDCCNTQIGATTPSSISVNTLFSRASHSLDTNKLRELFLGSQGNVWATAASPGEASWCGVKGGFFLLSFIESLRYQISSLTEEKPSWDSLINLTIDEAYKKTTSNGVPRVQNGIKQVKTKSVK